MNQRLGRTCDRCKCVSKTLTPCPKCGFLLWCSTSCRALDANNHRDTCACLWTLMKGTPGFGLTHKQSRDRCGTKTGQALFPPSALCQLEIRNTVLRSVETKTKMLIMSTHSMDVYEQFLNGFDPNNDSTALVRDTTSDLFFMVTATSFNDAWNNFGDLMTMIQEQSDAFIRFAENNTSSAIPTIILVIDEEGQVSGYRLSVLMDNFTV